MTSVEGKMHAWRSKGVRHRSPKTVAFLHTLGHDAVHLSEQGLER